VREKQFGLVEQPTADMDRIRAVAQGNG